MPVLALHRVELGLGFFSVSIQLALAQSCWRNTVCSSIQTASFPGDWDTNIFAPSSRTVIPSILLDTSNGNRINAWPDQANLGSNQTSMVFDFGVEVGGIVTVDYTVSSVVGSNAMGLAFTEAKNWIGPNSDSTSGNSAEPDGALYVSFSGTGDFTYVMPDDKLRGGFRYMTLFLRSDQASVSIRNVSLEIAFQPTYVKHSPLIKGDSATRTWSNLRAYQGYFHSNDDLLNKIWYSGAYTLQTGAVPPQTGRSWPAPADGGWENNGNLGPGVTILTDGAKRDRTVWPGDLGVAVPASFYSTGDVESTKNALQTLYDNQNPATGEFPFSGPPLLASGSSSYHMWTMIGTYNYVFFADDIAFISQNWAQYTSGMAFAINQTDSTGLFYSSSNTSDWGRVAADGALTSLQALFFQTLITGATLAEWIGDTTGLNETWLEEAKTIKALTNANNWDDSAGAFIDTPERTNIHPQDGNALAVLFGIVNSSSNEASRISSYLMKNWTPIGAECEELPGEISPFISSFEIQAHFLVGQTQRALDLIRSSWGWYLNNPNGTQSTMIEGYLVNGTFGYRWDQGYNNDFSYTSHSHGWATGPVSALTNYVLGFSITDRAGSTWQLAPQPGDLTHVEGGFTTKLGQFSASWTRESDGSIQLNYSTPVGTTGDIIVPLEDNQSNYAFDEATGKRRSKHNTEVREVGKRFTMRSEGGEHSIRIYQRY